MQVFIALFFLGMGARAELFEEVADDYCDPQYYDCSLASLDILKNYYGANAAVLNGEESLYTGSCYMVSASYNKDHEHHAYLYFRQNADRLDFFGLFSFFAEENPYVNMTLEDARKLNPKASDYKVKISPAQWRVDTNVEPPWQYFMRELDGKLYVVGFWGYNDSITCVLDKK